MNAGNAYAWRMLGTAHAENDDDQQAIAAMAKALSADPDNPAVLLALGVSHVNELHAGEAVRYLMRCGYWCCNEQGFVGGQGPPLTVQRLRTVQVPAAHFAGHAANYSF
jgi:hypothetical protein